MLTLFIYIPTAITMAAISDFILSVLWGLQPYCPLFCVNFTAAPPKKQPVAVVAIYILRTFALKLSIVTLVFAMFADTMDSFNECEMAACHDLHRAPDTPMPWLVASPFMRHRPTVLAFTMLGQPPTRICFFYPLPKKIGTCSLQNIYFSYFCLLIIS